MRVSALRIAAAVLLLVTAIGSTATHLVLSKRGDSLVEHIGDLTWNARVYRSGHLPLWNPYLYAGIDQPALAQTATYYPVAIALYALFPPVTAFNLSLVLHLLLAAFFMRRYLQALSLSPHAVSLGALTFACCGFAFVHKGLIPMANAAAWIPALFYCVERWLQTNEWKYPLWGGACLAMQLFAGWPQFVLLSGIYLVLYVLFALPAATKKWTFVSGIAVLFAFSAAVGLAQILPTLELKRFSNLSAMPFWLYASNSYPPKLLFLLIFPYLFGADFPSAFAPYSWGPREFAFSTIYVGIFPLLLAAASLVMWRRSRPVRYASALVAISTYLALGTFTHFGRQLYRVPVYNFFRDHYAHFQFFAFGVAILAAVALSGLQKGQIQPFSRKLIGIVVPLLFAAIAMTVWVRARSIVGTFHLQDRDWTAHLDWAFSLRSPALMVALATIVLSLAMFYFLTRFPISRSAGSAAVVLVAFDLGIVGLFSEHLPTRFEPTAAEQSILSLLREGTAQQSARVLSLLPDTNFLRPNENLLQPYPDILGFGSLVPQPYGELLSLGAAGETPEWRELIANQRILSLLRVRYILVTSRQLDLLRPMLGAALVAAGSPAGCSERALAAVPSAFACGTLDADRNRGINGSG